MTIDLPAPGWAFGRIVWSVVCARVCQQDSAAREGARRVTFAKRRVTGKGSRLVGRVWRYRRARSLRIDVVSDDAF